MIGRIICNLNFLFSKKLLGKGQKKNTTKETKLENLDNILQYVLFDKSELISFLNNNPKLQVYKILLSSLIVLYRSSLIALLLSSSSRTAPIFCFIPSFPVSASSVNHICNVSIKSLILLGKNFSHYQSL